MTFLLRGKHTFDNDTQMQKYIKNGQAKLSFGDAMSSADVKKALDLAGENGPISFITFSIGESTSVPYRSN